jgi:hypothetical protein
MDLNFAYSATQNSQNEKLKMEKLNLGDYPSIYGIQIKYLKLINIFSGLGTSVVLFLSKSSSI